MKAVGLKSLITEVFLGRDFMEYGLEKMSQLLLH